MFLSIRDDICTNIAEGVVSKLSSENEAHVRSVKELATLESSKRALQSEIEVLYTIHLITLSSSHVPCETLCFDEE